MRGLVVVVIVPAAVFCVIVDTKKARALAPNFATNGWGASPRIVVSVVVFDFNQCAVPFHAFIRPRNSQVKRKNTQKNPTHNE